MSTPTPTTNYVATLQSSASTYADFAASQPLATIYIPRVNTQYEQSFYYTISTVTVGNVNDTTPIYYGSQINLNIYAGYYANIGINTQGGYNYYYAGSYTFRPGNTGATGHTGATGYPYISILFLKAYNP